MVAGSSIAPGKATIDGDKGEDEPVRFAPTLVAVRQRFYLGLYGLYGLSDYFCLLENINFCPLFLTIHNSISLSRRTLLDDVVLLTKIQRAFDEEYSAGLKAQLWFIVTVHP